MSNVFDRLFQIEQLTFLKNLDFCEESNFRYWPILA